MVSTLLRRSVLILALLGGHLLLAVGFSAFYPAPSAGTNYHFGSDELTQNYDQYINEEVRFQGEIIDTDPTTVRVRHDGTQTLELTLTGPQANELGRGDTVELTGVVERDHTLTVTGVVKHSSRDLGFTYLISFLAGLLVLFRIVQQWQIVRDDGAIAFSPKPSYRSLPEWVATTLPGGNDD